MFSVATALAIKNRCGLVDGVAREDGSKVMPMSMPSIMVEHRGGGIGVHGCRHYFDEFVVRTRVLGKRRDYILGVCRGSAEWHFFAARFEPRRCSLHDPAISIFHVEAESPA